MVAMSPLPAVEWLPTATVADACLQLAIPVRVAPAAVRPLVSGMRCRGRAYPVRHHGSVDVFLAALDAMQAGEILVVDNGGRDDEGCLGDLVALEAAAVGVGGVIVWGCHRDTARLVAIDLPLFSLGACPRGPVRSAGRNGHAGGQLTDPATPVNVGSVTVSRDDLVIADDDGVLFLSAEDAARVTPVAREIQRIELDQADALAHGQPLRDQLRFDAYRTLRRRDPDYTFRDHVRRMNGAIEV